MAEVYEERTGRVPVEHVGSHWVVALPRRRPAVSYAVAKRLVDVAVAGAGLLATLVLLPFVALAIRLDSPGPVFSRQERTGRLGRPFRLATFRSMVADAEGDGRAVWARQGDARVTRVGRFLRKSRLDELPQRWNVLRGDMSLLGPRPERPPFVAVLERELPFSRARLLLVTQYSALSTQHSSAAGPR